MTDRPGKKLFPNPFYVLLLVASVLFVVTVFAYLAGPTVRQQAAADAAHGGGPSGLADWLDRRGPLALGVEVSFMIVTGLLAMATDRWFPSRPARKGDPTS